MPHIVYQLESTGVVYHPGGAAVVYHPGGAIVASIVARGAAVVNQRGAPLL